MSDPITFIKECANVGIPTLMVVIAGYWLIFVFPKWQERVDEGKKERAEIHAGALKEVSKQIALQSEKIAVFGLQVENFGKLVESQGRLTERLIDMMDDHHNVTEEQGERCEAHGKIMEKIYHGLTKKTA